MTVWSIKEQPVASLAGVGTLPADFILDLLRAKQAPLEIKDGLNFRGGVEIQYPSVDSVPEQLRLERQSQLPLEGPPRSWSWTTRSYRC